ncbi:hypothetical protein MASR2M70_17340 [Bacillota bacterium]
MKRRNKLMIWIMVLGLLLNTAACSSDTGDSQSTGTAKPASGGQGLGNASFELDSISAALKYDPELTDQSISLTDKGGATWTLILPPGALLAPEEITMTALSDIKSDKLGNIEAGVELKPDGLQFLIPVEIRVEGGGLDNKDIILSSNSQGENLEFAGMSSNTYLQAELYHFSNKYAASRTGALDKILLEEAENNIKAATDRAEELLGQPIQVPPPPAVALPEKCGENEQDEAGDAVQAYIKEFQNPEMDTINSIVAAMRSYELIALESYDPEYTIVKKLIKRLFKKCDKLISSYYPQDEYFLPVGITVLSSVKSVIYFTKDGEEKYYFEEISNWGLEVIDEYISDIRDKHLYSKMYPILWLGKRVTLLGGGSAPQDFGSNILYKLGRVMNFRIEFTNTLTGGQMELIAEGKANKIAIDVTSGTSGLYKGKGEGAYKKATFEAEEVTILQPNPFKFNGLLWKFEPCHSDSFSILIDAFGPQSDVFIAAGVSQPVSGIINGTTGVLFEEYIIEDPAFLSLINTGTMVYEFELPLQNGNEIAGEKKIKSSIGDLTIDYSLRLVHTPLGIAKQ